MEYQDIKALKEKAYAAAETATKDDPSAWDGLVESLRIEDRIDYFLKHGKFPEDEKKEDG